MILAEILFEWRWALWLGVAVVCIALDSLYCGMETGVYVMNKIRLDLHARAGVAPAVFLQRMLRRPRPLLAVLLMGTNICRYTSTFAVTTLFLMAGAARASLYTELIMTPLLFVVADAVPKNVFRRLGERPMYVLARLLKGSYYLFHALLLAPVVVLVSSGLMRLSRAGRRDGGGGLFREGLAAAMAEGQASGVLTHLQSVMADRVINLPRVRVREVMVPMEKVVTAPSDVSRGDLLEVLRTHEFSRIPLTENGQVVSVLDIYEALTVDKPPQAVTSPPHFLDASVSVAEALYRLQREHAVFAVIQEGTRHAGIVTIKDLVEEIVGEIEVW